MNSVYADELVLNTGAPQGCVLSLQLFSTYTNEMTVHNINVHLFKYADDMALVGLLLKDNVVHEEDYFSQVTVLQNWCQASNLESNVTKTKELIIQTKPSRASNICCVILKNQLAEEMEHFKY